MHRTILDTRNNKETKTELSTEESVLLHASAPVLNVIREIDSRRFRLALLQLGLLDNVELAVSTMNRAAKVNWAHTAILKENDPLLVTLVSNLKLNLDQILTLAASLP